LSGVAARYETYKFVKLSFRYYTQSASTQTGVVGLAFDFDALDPAPSSQFQALSYRDRAQDAVWKELVLNLDLAQGDKLPTRYTRTGLPASPYDLKTFDLGNLHVFTEGVSAATIGLLEATYVVNLFTPQIQDPPAGTEYGGAGLDATHLIGTDAAADAQACLPYVFTSSQSITFKQVWEGILTFRITGSVLSANYAPVPGGGGECGTVLQIVNAGATEVIGFFRVRARPGSTLTPTITATTVVSSRLSLGIGSYESYI